MAMAHGLLWKNLAGSVADGVTASNSDTEFDHDLDDGAGIREITIEVALGGAGPDNNGEVELTEVPSRIGNTNNTDFWKFGVRIEMPATGATPVDGGLVRTRTKKYARGQLVIRESKKLYVNVSKTTGGICSYRIEIGYEPDQ